MIFLDPNSHPVKMSAVILEFADGMLRHAAARSEKKKAITLACLVWNQNNGEYQAQMASHFKKIRIKDQLGADDMEQLIDAFLADKKIN